MSHIALFGEALIDSFPDEDVLGGAPLNAACALAALGCNPLLISAIGLDQRADAVRAVMRRFDLDQRGLQVDPFHPTGRVAVELSATGHRFDILPNQAYDHIDHAEAAAAMASVAPAILYFGTMAQRQEVSRNSLQALLHASNALKYLDLNLREGTYTAALVAESLQQADILKANESELHYLLGQFVAPGTDFSIGFTEGAQRARLLPALQSLLDQFSLQSMAITLGERGYAYLARNGRLIYDETPYPAEKMVDTVGCGDGFSAALLTGMLSGWPIERSLHRARQFATAICSVRGGVAGDIAFYRNWRERWDDEDRVSVK